jgi:hypothetical protein
MNRPFGRTVRLAMKRASLALLLLSGAAAAGTMRAARTAERIAVDGALDEPAWQQAPEFSSFVESWPHEGSVPTQKTSVRVLYDDKNVYVGIVCFDTEPEKIVRTLGRRDSTPAADLVEIAIDSSHSRRSAYYFSVNAAGVQRDALLVNDVNSRRGTRCGARQSPRGPMAGRSRSPFPSGCCASPARKSSAGASRCEGRFPAPIRCSTRPWSRTR